jgi:membrane-bound lytic murein transglycosylase D
MLKTFVFGSVFVLFSTASFGQSSAAPASKRVAKSDTIVVRKPALNSKGTIAMPIAIAMPKAVKPKPKVYKHVPLANEKEYYGSMSGFVNEFVTKYSRTHNQTIHVVHGRSNTQFPLMENVLQKHEIPKELKYLAVIESALNNKAVSHAGAVGPWQLMAPTARLMGLKVGKGRDDRTDWYKSTNAAAKYLVTLYDDLNDWLLVVAAYNSGPTPIKRAIEKTGSNNFWDIKKYLPKETQGHVLAFIATATIFENMGKFMKPGDITGEIAAPGTVVAPPKPRFTPEELKMMAIVKLTEPMSMDLLIHELGLDKNLMEKWNEDYDMYEFNLYPEETYSLRLPKDKLESFLNQKEYLQRKSKQVFSAQNM